MAYRFKETCLEAIFSTVVQEVNFAHWESPRLSALSMRQSPRGHWKCIIVSMVMKVFINFVLTSAN